MNTNKINELIINRIAPHKVLLYAWVIWLFFYFISPYDYYGLGDFTEALFFLFLINFSFYLGLNYKSERKIKTSSLMLRYTTSIAKTLNTTIFLGAIGSALYIYQKIKLIANISFESVAVNKNQILEQGIQEGGLLNIISALLFPFCYVSFIILITYRNSIPKRKSFFYFFISITPIVFLTFLGSRSLTFFYFFTALFVLIMNPSKRLVNFERVKYKDFGVYSFIKRRISFRKMLVITSVSLLFVFFFTKIQSDRIESMQNNQRLYYNAISESQLWDYKENHLINVLVQNEPHKYIGLLSFIHYQVHGVYEFSRLYSSLDSKLGYFYGKYQFYPFYKFFSAIGFDIGDNFNEMENIKERSGVFTTFWGPFYLDFGYFGILLIFFIGRFVKRVSVKTNTTFFNKIIYPYILTIIITSPILNTFTGSLLYNLVAIFIASLIYKLKINS